MWAPYDDATYDDVLQYIKPGSVVLDIGAGDLRLARRIATRARLVIALEIDASLLANQTLPVNVQVMTVDARTYPFPEGVDTAVLLMRHCTQPGLYINKLLAVDCRHLITNARWGMGVECIDLRQPPLPYAELRMGWYACRCGATGFREGPAELIQSDLIQQVHEVATCPVCEQYGRNRYRFS